MYNYINHVKVWVIKNLMSLNKQMHTDCKDYYISLISVSFEISCTWQKCCSQCTSGTGWSWYTLILFNTVTGYAPVMTQYYYSSLLYIFYVFEFIRYTPEMFMELSAYSFLVMRGKINL